MSAPSRASQFGARGSRAARAPPTTSRRQQRRWRPSRGRAAPSGLARAPAVPMPRRTPSARGDASRGAPTPPPPPPRARRRARRRRRLHRRRLRARRRRDLTLSLGVVRRRPRLPPRARLLAAKRAARRRRRHRCRRRHLCGLQRLEFREFGALVLRARRRLNLGGRRAPCSPLVVSRSICRSAALSSSAGGDGDPISQSNRESALGPLWASPEMVNVEDVDELGGAGGGAVSSERVGRATAPRRAGEPSSAPAEGTRQTSTTQRCRATAHIARLSPVGMLEQRWARMR